MFVKVRIGGTVITNTHRATMQRVRSLPGIGDAKCFAQHTTELIGYGEAAETSLPVWEHQSQNAERAASKREYEMITGEFVQRF
jgi:hypothetical protein